MTRLLKPLAEWTEADVQALITEQIEESQRLEYKRELTLATQGNKAEACKDVSGMANAVGGLIIYGVEERKLPEGRRIPVATTPISDGGAAAQLEDVLYGSVSPQLNFATAMLSAAEGSFFLLVRVQQRSGPLHMVEGQGQHRYFIRGGPATRPMEAHEVEAAFRALASSALRLEDEAAQLPLVPRIAATRMRHRESGALEPGELPWVSVVVAPLDPGAELPMRTPSPYDFAVSDLNARYLREAYYLTDGNYSWDTTGYLSRAEEDGALLRVLRLYRNGWCEWGYRYMWRPDDPKGERIPGLVLGENTHDALLYFAQTYADRGYFGRLRVWVRVDNADNSTLVLETGQRRRSPGGETISFEVDTSVERVLTEPLSIIHAAMDRVWQGYGLSRCPNFSPEGELLRRSR